MCMKYIQLLKILRIQAKLWQVLVFLRSFLKKIGKSAETAGARVCWTVVG